jgi:hypothetical protein
MYRHEDLGVFARLAIVDYAAIVTLAVVILEKRIRPTVPVVLYGGALVLSLFLARLAAREEGTSAEDAWIAFGTLALALGYYFVGHAAAQRPSLARALLAGIAVGVCFESVVVLHDYFASSQWFPDARAGRVRGTFRASGQLGAYAFSSAGILLTLAPAWFRRNRARIAFVVAGAMAVFFVFAASRRSAIFALAAWLGIFLVLGARRVGSKAYVAALGTAVLACLALGTLRDRLSDTFFWNRVVGAVHTIQDDDNFIAHQARYMADRADEWFPFGMGVGRGLTPFFNGEIYEIHNGHLAIVVELGVLGFVAFYLMVLLPVFGKWGPHPATRRIRPLVAAFLFAAMLFMIHNRLQRDRGFMLFLGMATVLSAAGVAPDPKGASLPCARPATRGTGRVAWRAPPRRAPARFPQHVSRPTPTAQGANHAALGVRHQRR